jgi:hypothetical protein
MHSPPPLFLPSRLRTHALARITSPFARVNGVFSLGKIGCSGACACDHGCVCDTMICVKDCSGNPVDGATITVGSLAPVTLGPTSNCETICIDSLGGAGTYVVQVSKSGFTSYNQSLSLSCGGSTTVNLATSGNICNIFPYCAWPGGGNNPKPYLGCTLTVAGVQYAQNMSTGGFLVALTGNGSYPCTISCPDSCLYSGTLTVTGTCTISCPIDPVLSCGSNVCCPGGVAYPTTLNLADSVYGAVTLTWDNALQLWTGTATVNYAGSGAGCFLCTAVTGVIITYTWNCAALDISSTYTAGPLLPCPGIGGGSGLSYNGVSPSSMTNYPLDIVWTLPTCASPYVRTLYPNGGTLILTP